MTTKEKKPLISPRIAALKQELEAGNTAALDAFWREVAEQGTPLIEPIEDDDSHVLVTFLWRAREEIKNVVVIGALGRWDLDEGLAKNQKMARLLDTDLWYKTYRSMSDARFTYLLSPNDPLLDPGSVGNGENQKIKRPLGSRIRLTRAGTRLLRTLKIRICKT